MNIWCLYAPLESACFWKACYATPLKENGRDLPDALLLSKWCQTLSRCQSPGGHAQEAVPWHKGRAAVTQSQTLADMSIIPHLQRCCPIQSHPHLSATELLLNQTAQAVEEIKVLQYY